MLSLGYHLAAQILFSIVPFLELNNTDSQYHKASQASVWAQESPVGPGTQLNRLEAPISIAACLSISLQ